MPGLIAWGFDSSILLSPFLIEDDMIVDELIALLHLGKLEIRDGRFFASITPKARIGGPFGNRFHIFLDKPDFGFFGGEYKLRDASTKRVLCKGPEVKNLYKEIKKYIDSSLDDKTEKTRQTVHKVLEGHFDDIIKNYK